MRCSAPRGSRAAFTLPEVLISIIVVGVIGAGALLYTSLSGRSLASIYAQSVLNQKAAYVSEVIARQVRLANSVSNDVSGNTLYLGFDDDLTTDTNGDGSAFNDVNRVELFQFQNGDGSDTTLADNRLIYRPDASQGAFQVLLERGVRKLPGTNVFTVTSNRVVMINLGLLDESGGNYTQTIEIKSRVIRRNTTLAE
jgi:prepilin-type N-terminal cleavage/methylation domain-containing protein